MTIKKDLGDKIKSAVKDAVCDNDVEGLQGPSAEAIARLQKEGRKVLLVGRVKNGKVELDQSRLDDMARKYPNANMAFVAVNAPFDPLSNVA